MIIIGAIIYSTRVALNGYWYNYETLWNHLRPLAGEYRLDGTAWRCSSVTIVTGDNSEQLH